ncbi:MAG: signal peptidase I [bacterium]|nr:signal peptidase I [bacterium]
MTITKDGIVSSILDFVETIVVSLAIFFVIYIFIAQPHQVNGHSMDPTMQTGEYLLTEKISYRLREPERGEIIVFKAPASACIGSGCDFIKRIIALPGETVKIVDGKFYVNGQALDESTYLAGTTITQPGAYTADEREITLGTDQYFVSGDNRANSADSRYWGPISKNAIIGRAFVSYWPFAKMGLIEHANAN